ncbi:RagB/SusD family nutrient uptake outer membrane protein [Aestuariibaculum sediminum]|uniref:RagB/SusD family nutrient uptake outer membrane protein n=1 Tax=Aestuariibaculum sediminum TaxID=2770637 RepID=A0A8J6PXV3_9FLAO|nr:RagB/SusD family nutrient uptake outer membrane protein [Aestuariibaculum sediminum]MBD0830827.1 RagB/SusD family nutrient uptake outer membrane protein [Aestuariibaculum sediminum]
MKLKYLLAIIPAFLIASCEKDFLEPESISTTDLNYVYSNVDDARSGVNAVYQYFNQDAFRSRLSNNMTGNTDIERQSGWTSASDRYQIWNLDAQPSNRDLDIVWTYAYQAIRDANIAIEGINNSGNLENADVTIKDEFYNLLGEAYTLRAYWYSMLAYYFGDVPYVTKAPRAGDNFDLPRTHRNEILSGEIENLISVEENMKWQSQTRHGIEQVNREYTLGMIARLALQRGGYYLTPELNMVRDSDYLDYYKIARDYSKKLIDLKDRQLPSDFRKIFMNQCQFIVPTEDSDILFEVPFPQGGGDVGWNIGITVQGGATAKHSYGSGNNYMSMPATYYMSFDSKDKRRDVTCGLWRINTDAEYEHVGLNISQGKWSRWFLPEPPGQNTAKGTAINWPMMRYADVLLMFAEAENELNGPTAEAQDAFKRIRRRAFDAADWSTKVDNYVAQISASKQDFFNAIVDERAWEFGGEMIRKYELIRWNLYSQKMEETVEGLKKLADEAFDGTGTGPDYMYWKVEDGEFVVLNPDNKILAAPDETWNRQSFLSGLHSDETTYQEWILRDYENHINGPKAGVARYIFPTPTSAVINSKGLLSNRGQYGFNFN